MPAVGPGQQDLSKLVEELERVGKLADKHEVELHGPRGLYDALTEVYALARWSNRAMWGIAVAIMAAAVSAAITALTGQ